MNKTGLVLAAAAIALGAGASFAQGGPGIGGPGMQGAGPGASAPGMGPGMRGGRGPAAHWGAAYTPGWAMMTPQERTEHQERMRSMKTYDECKAYQQKHHDEMAARAKERGGKPLAQPRRDACAPLRR